MGIVMHKLIQIGEYCDCLQNWKKYEIGQTASQSNLFMSQNESNLEDPIDKVFDHQKIESGLDKQLQMMQQRLRKRKKLKADFLKQKDKQLKAKQLDEERKDRERRQNLQKQRELWLRQQELKKLKQMEAEKLRKENQQKKVRANKRNKRIKEKNLEKHLQVQIQNNTFSTADQNAQKEQINEAENVPEQRQQDAQKQKQKQVIQKLVKEKANKRKKTKKTKNKRRESTSSSSSSSSSSSRSNQSQQQSQYKNVFQQPQYYQQQQRYIPQKDQLHYHQQQASDLDSALFSHRKQQTTEIQIIDLQKLNQHQLRQQVSSLVIKKLKDRLDSQPVSKTVPLHPAIHSHRVSNNVRNYDQRRDQLKMMERDEGEEDGVEFVDGQMHSTIIEKHSNDYFLDQNDRDEYLKEMFR